MKKPISLTFQTNDVTNLQRNSACCQPMRTVVLYHSKLNAGRQSIEFIARYSL